MHFLIFNIYALIRLPENAELYGSLNKMSANSFEIYLGEMKKFIRSPNKPNKPLQTLYCRLIERNTRFPETESYNNDLKLFGNHLNYLQTANNIKR